MKKRNLTLRFGIYMFVSIVALFFLMKLFGVEQVTELRLLNIVIAAWFSNKLALANLIQDSDINYVSNLGSIFFANLIAVGLSCVALIIYIKVIDTSFLNTLENGFFLGKNLSIGHILTALFMEGSATSIIVSFCVMQYWKNEKRVMKKFDIKKF